MIRGKRIQILQRATSCQPLPSYSQEGAQLYQYLSYNLLLRERRWAATFSPADDLSATAIIHIHRRRIWAIKVGRLLVEELRQESVSWLSGGG
jgi:hypothetical protein